MSNPIRFKNMEFQRKQLIAVGLFLLACIFFIGFAVGSITGHQVTKTVAKPVTHTVTKTVNVPTVPQACLSALDEADNGFTQAAAVSQSFLQVIQGVQDQDVDAITSATADIKTVNGKLHSIALVYNTDKDECRNAAQ